MPGKIIKNPAIFYNSGHASTGGMFLHAIHAFFSPPASVPARPEPVHAPANRPMRRADVAGRALRAFHVGYI